MFGGFGQQTSTPFGSFGTTPSTPSFGGTTTFGAPATSGFSNPTTFGSSTATNFGANPSSTFGGTTFGGSPAPGSTFGSTPFGTSSTPSFGGTTPTSAPFGGASSTFGGTPSFGGTTGGLFGGTTGSTFGAPTGATGGLFGSSTTSATPSTGMFGSTPTPSAFGGSYGTTTTPATTSFGGFGATPTTSFGMQETKGTGNPPYKPTPDTDTSTGAVLNQVSITAMPNYANKSFEELRWEDMQMKKQPGQQPQSSLGSFGSTTTPFGGTTGTFGSTTTGTTGGLFGSTGPFGGTNLTTTPTTSFGTFGASATTTPSTGLFGTTSTTPATAFSSPFGGTSATPSTSTPFGTTSTTAPFGSSTSFGASTATPSSFGGFGTSTTTPSTTSQFGGFGSGMGMGTGTGTAPTTTPFSISSTPSSTFGAYGTTTTPSTSATPSLFGGSQPTGGSLFGSTPIGTTGGSSLFGGTSTQPSLFGGTTAPSSSLFGGTSAGTGGLFPAYGTTGFGSTATQPYPFPTSFANPAASPPMKTATLTGQPFGVVPSLGPSVAGTPIPPTAAITAITPKPPKSVSTTQYKLTPRSAAKIKPRGFTPSRAGKGLFEETALSPDVFVPRQSVKKLIIDTTEEESTQDKTTNTSVNISDGAATPQRPTDQSIGAGYTPMSASKFNDSRFDGDDNNAINNELPKLTKKGYYTTPNRDELAQLSSSALSRMNGFCVGAQDLGKIEFLGITDVRGADLDSIIHFSRGEIVVYPDERKKPPIGEGFNKPAIITLHGVFQVDPVTKKPLTDEISLNRMEQKIKKSTARQGAILLRYDKTTGDWIFQVQHFSRYGLVEDSDDEEQEVEKQAGVKHPEKTSEKRSKSEEHPVIQEKEEETKSPNRFKIEESSEEEDQEEPIGQQVEEEFTEEPPIESLETYAFQEEVEEQPLYEEPTSEEQEEEEQEATMEEMSPPQIQLPQQLGLDPTKMQVMKSFLFEPKLSRDRKDMQNRADEEIEEQQDEIEEESKEIQPVSEIVQIPKKLIPMETILQKTPYLKPQLKNALMTLERKRKILPLDIQSTYKQEKNILDSGLFMGRSFRVCWGRDGTLIHSGVPVGKPKSTEVNVGTITIEKVFTIPGVGSRESLSQPVSKDNQIIPLLEVNQNTSKIGEVDSLGVPCFVLNDVQSYIHQTINCAKQILDSKSVSLASVDSLKHILLVFKLVHALCGVETGGDALFKGAPMYFDDPALPELLARKRAVNDWLMESVHDAVFLEISQSSDKLDALFSYLTGKLIKDATKTAIESKEFHLGTLVAQSVNTYPDIRSDLSAQIDLWQRERVINKVPQKKLKIYKLLSGDVNSVSQSMVDWKRCFGLHFWFDKSIKDSIYDVVRGYENSYHRRYQIPLPSYFQGNNSELPKFTLIEDETRIGASDDGTMYSWDDKWEFWKKNPSSGNIWKKVTDHSEAQRLRDGETNFVSVSTIGIDTAFHVLKLFIDRSYSVSKSLHANSSSPFALDYRLPWHLYCVFKALNPEGVEILGDLIMNYVGQLLMCDMWQWAVYVLLHMPSKCLSRVSAIQEILARHAPELDDHKEFLLKVLQLPPQLLHEVKAWYYSYTLNPREEAIHYIQSNKYQEALTVLLKQVAPRCILRNDTEELFALLSQINAHRESMIDWELGGRVYYDFLLLSKELKKISENFAQNVESLSALDSAAQLLSKNLADYIKKREKERKISGDDSLPELACFSELSTHLTRYSLVIKKELAALQNRSMDVACLSIPRSMESLSIPEDHRLKYLNELCDHYLSARMMPVNYQLSS